MKIRRSVLLLIVLAAVLIALMAWFGRRKPAETPLAVSTQTNICESSALRPAAPAPALRTNATAASTNATKPPPGGKAEQMSGILSTYNDVPIDFYGKLEDQFGYPVVGAEIKGSIRVINGVRRGTDWLSATSDESGLFQFHGKGQDIGMMPRKEGYVYVSMNGTGNYSLLSSEEGRAHPDPNNPVILKLWKLQGAEHLVSFDFRTEIPADESPVALDFQTGQRVTNGGDVVIRLLSSSTPSIREEYDWRVAIQPFRGGIVKSDGSGLDKMFQAPESGYSLEFSTNYQRGTRPWTSRFNEAFYFTSRDGKVCGKFALSIITDRIKREGVPVVLSGYLNPAGSRNLEVDPTMVTAAHP